MNEALAERFASMVYALVENSYEYELSITEGECSLSYAEACKLLNLDPYETERVLALIDDDLANV